jgi:hypothetical protein
MELALTAIIIAAVVLLLQIVSLAQIAGIRRSMRMQRDSRPQQIQQSGDRFDKRSQDFRRHERRPFQEQRPQQPAAAATHIDPVEKSLRDLNLRLKSAEREQESARRKIQENFPRGDHFRGRDDRGRGGNRDRDRNSRRDNWQDRNRSGGFQQQQPAPAAPQQPRSEPVIEQKAVNIPAPESTVPVRQAVPQDAQETIISDFSPDQNLQHGRKIIVKRRVLKEDVEAETSAESTSVEEAPSRAPQAPAASAEQTTPPSSPAISFPTEHREEETKVGDAGPATNPDGGITFGRR